MTFLDDALGGMLPHDLVVLGARTGAGKTTLATIIAEHAARHLRGTGKVVCFASLESEPHEIYRRIKHRVMIRLNTERGVRARPTFQDFRLCRTDPVFDHVDDAARNELDEACGALQVMYRPPTGAFGVDELRKAVLAMQAVAALYIVDHLHFVDLEGDNELAEMRSLVATLRGFALEIGVPVLAVAHLRKRTADTSVVPDLEEFHGTSDITKIATHVITIAPAHDAQGAPGCWRTYCRVAKNRFGGASPFIGILDFDPERGTYNDVYGIGRVKGREVERVPMQDRPSWARKV